jgi:uncharacterized membrane protein YgaE (UPF0421/DUF939 family)
VNLELLLRARARQGWARVRRAAAPVLLASVAAAGAYAVARYGLGHPLPFFAPVAAWICLGFTADRQPRRVAEVAIGVAIGVLAGDLLVLAIGTGPVQVAVVLTAAVLLARFLDRGDLLAMQAGVQAMVIAVLPAASSGGPVGRWLDALVGGAVALVVAALSPQDPRRRVRSHAEEAATEIADVLGVLAAGLRHRSPDEVERALLRGRASQAVLDQWRSAAASARQVATVSPAFRRHRDELAELEAAAVLADRAMRNARVLARRARSVADRREPGVPERLDALADVLDQVRAGTQDLGTALSTGAQPLAAQRTLTAAARATDPWRIAPGNLHVQGLVLLLRSLVVDLEETAGIGPEEARAALPEI